MGNLKSGAIALVQYDVPRIPDSAEDPLGLIAAQIKKKAFRDIDDTTDEYSVGWVSVMDMFDSMFESSPIQIGEFVFLIMRFDERKVPAAALSKFRAKKEREVMKEKGIPKLSRSFRLEIKEAVTAQMTRQAPPVPTMADVVWNPESGSLFLLSTNSKVMSLFEDLFLETFEMAPSQSVPYTMAEKIVGDKEILEGLQPSVIA